MPVNHQGQQPRGARKGGETRHVKKRFLQDRRGNCREEGAPKHHPLQPRHRSDIDDLEEGQLDRPGPSQRTRTPWAVPLPKSTATSCSSSCRRNTPGVCMTVSGWGRGDYATLRGDAPEAVQRRRRRYKGLLGWVNGSERTSERFASCPSTHAYINHRTAGTDFTLPAHHPACEEGEQPKEDARRNRYTSRAPLRHAAGPKSAGATFLQAVTRRALPPEFRGATTSSLFRAVAARAWTGRPSDWRTSSDEYPDVESPPHGCTIYTDKTRSRLREGKKSRWRDELSGRALRHLGTSSWTASNSRLCPVGRSAGKGYRHAERTTTPCCVDPCRWPSISCTEFPQSHDELLLPFPRVPLNYLYTLPDRDGLHHPQPGRHLTTKGPGFGRRAQAVDSGLVAPH